MQPLRVTPRPWIGLAVVAGYAVLISAVQRTSGIPYTDLGDDADTLFRGAGIPLMAGAVALAITTTALGWWRPALSERALPEERRARHRWPIVAPVLLGLVVVLNLVAVDWPAYSLPFLGASVVLLLVGFTEEVAVRGLLLTALRARLPEGWCWFLSTAVFGALHLINIAAGLPPALAVVQGINAFLFGTALYILRRTTGTLAWCMVLHAAWDFSLFALQQGTAGPFADAVAPLELGIGVLALIVVRWAVVGRGRIGA